MNNSLKKSVLLILDGWGIAANPKVSAVDIAKTPFMDSLKKDSTGSQLEASGLSVGLPIGQMGNSEVGHMNLGAGRIVYQDLAKIDIAIEKKTISQNETFQNLLKNCKEKRLHLIGLVSDGGVHSHVNHLKGLLTLFAEEDIDNIYLHAFTDGRDTDPKSGKGFLQDVDTHMKKTTGQIASICGRYYSMDRDNRWERIQKAYNLIIKGEGRRYNGNASDAIQSAYDLGQTDEFILPIQIKPIQICSGDVVLFFNFRTDRSRQLTRVISQENFPDYQMTKLNTQFYTLTKYDKAYTGVQVIFEKNNLKNTLGEVLENAGKRQIRIAETEKYPHVTFFFSGGREEKFNNEKRILCPSAKVATYDLMPEMSANEICEAIIPELENESADFICLNFANPDMVGHTGNISATIKAVETVDSCSQKLVDIGVKNNYTFFILADHGNADFMMNKDGSPNTAHTTQPVPFYIVTDLKFNYKLENGILGDVAPTILDWMGINKPKEMTGKSLITQI